jgi:hypothetical protein
MLQAFGTFFWVCLQIIDDSAVIKIAEMDDKINRKNGGRETKIVYSYQLPVLPMPLEFATAGKFNTGALKGAHRFEQELRIISPRFPSDLT